MNFVAGVPCSLDGVLIELLTLTNILSVNIIKMHVGSLLEYQVFDSSLCASIIKSLKRGKPFLLLGIFSLQKGVHPAGQIGVIPSILVRRFISISDFHLFLMHHFSGS